MTTDSMGAVAAPRIPLRHASDRVLSRLRSARIAPPELIGLLVLAAFLNLWALDRNGWANDYYAAAVRSMSSSWHNFFYASFDPAGVMTVDKPPLSLWVQTLSAKAFGYSSWSILVPQALMGVAAVGLTYDMTRRFFGRGAGFVAGLVLALTPITVAISRHNNPDALLVLCCVAALWFLVRGLEDGRTRWVVLSGVAVGLGFEAKMAAALIVVPALVAAWLWVAPRGRAIAARQLAAGGAAMAVVGLAWPVAVALTPADSRPWISGTSDNSIWSLITGYNGVGRLDGQAGGPGGAGPGGGGNSFFGGDAGPLRLLNQALGGQAGWLLGFAVVGGIAILVTTRLRRTEARSGWLIAVGGTFATTAVAFSFAQGIFHPYYVAQLAPFTAALVGAGAVQLARRGHAMRVLAPAAVAAGLFTTLAVLSKNDGQLGWLPPLLVAVGVGAVVALAIVDERRWRVTALAVALGALLIAPAVWSADTLGHPTNGTFPSGGPAATGDFGGRGGGGPGGGGPGGRGGMRRFGGPPQAAQGGAAPAAPGGNTTVPGGAGFGGPPPAVGGAAPGGGGPGAGGFRGGGGPGGGGPGGGGRGGMFGGNQSLTAVTRYAEQHGGGTIAVSSQSGASSVVQSGANVAAIGGFSGRESQVSVAWLADAVQQGRIRWVLTGGEMRGPGGDTRTGSTSAMAAVAQACTPVPSSAYDSAGATANAAGDSAGGGLYDCLGKADALRATGGGV